jgi:hypothetical protein
MELAVLAVLGGVGLLLARTTTPAGPYPTKPSGTNPIVRNSIPVKEAFGNRQETFGNRQATDANPNTSLRGSAAELDLMYKGLMGMTTPPIEPNPSGVKQIPTQIQIESATPDVMMNAGGKELTPNYIDSEYITSGLSGQVLPSTEFTHNNMQPFFGGRVRQNVDASANSGRLDRYTGAGTTQVKKQEVEQMFDNTQVPFGNVYGLEASSDFVQSRINEPRNRSGEKPFEQVRVAPALNEGYGSTGKGGFQQLEVNEYMMKNMKKTDDLRVETNPKRTYSMPVVEGKQFIGKSAESPGEVRKYRPDGFYSDEDGKHMGIAGQGEFTKEMNRPIQIMPETNRQDTSVEYTGAGASQDFGMNYVVGSYRKPQGTQYGGAGYRNADGSQYSSNPEDDYGKSSYDARPNERSYTSDRVMGLNLSPAEAGAVTTHFEDESRPTRRGETIGNIQQSGNATGYANGAPAITVWDPSDIARTTVREGTIHNDRFGIMAIADGPTRLTAYDPDDIARPTQKAQISAKSAYTGAPKAAHERMISHTFAYNMTKNPNKQVVSQGRESMGGNIQVFQGDEPNVTSRKLDSDIRNERELTVNRSIDVGPGSSDIGRVKYRAPFNLDVAEQRNTREIIENTQNNPLMQSLHLNAWK